MVLPKLFDRTAPSSPAVDKDKTSTRPASTLGANTRSGSSTSHNAPTNRSAGGPGTEIEKPLTSRTTSSSPEKKSASKVAKDRSKDKARKPDSPRTTTSSSSKSSHRKSSSAASKYDPDSHPLNLPPEELRRLSHLSRLHINSQAAMADDETTASAAPQTNGTAAAATNGADKDSAPAPPPHKDPTSPPPVDAEACKAAGNKFFKAREYAKAIQEYTKGAVFPYLFYLNDFFPSSQLSFPQSHHS